MLPAIASVPVVEPPAVVLAEYKCFLAHAGHGNSAYTQQARSFMRRFPDPQRWAGLPLTRRLSENPSARAFVMFLMITGRLQPGYDYLLERKLSSIWRYGQHSALAPDLHKFTAAATSLGFSARVTSAFGSQVIARLLIQTGCALVTFTDTDFDQFRLACLDRQQRTGKSCRHYLDGIRTCRQILFHLGVLPNPVEPTTKAIPMLIRMAAAPPALQPRLVAYLHRKAATCKIKTVSSLATRLAGFGAFLTSIDPHLESLADLDRCRHIEPFLISLTTA